MFDWNVKIGIEIYGVLRGLAGICIGFIIGEVD